MKTVLDIANQQHLNQRVSQQKIDRTQRFQKQLSSHSSVQNFATKSCLSTKNGSVVRMSENPLLMKMQNRGGSIPKAEKKETREFGRELNQNVGSQISLVATQHPSQ